VLAVIETHPVQYHAPVYRAIEQRFGVRVTAIYGSDFSVTGYHDADFAATFAWDTDLLSGYSSVFLSRVESGGPQSYDAVSGDGIRNALRELRPQAALILGYSPSFHRVAWFEAWRAGCRLLFRGETNDDTHPRNWVTARARGTALSVAYHSCDRFLYIGERSRQHYLRRGVPEERLVFSPYCVETSGFDADEDARVRWRSATRDRLGVNDSQVLLLFSGKLTERKGVDLLIEAARRALPDVRDRLTIGLLGDGPLRQSLAAAAQREPRVRVGFLGFQNQRALSPYYHAADLLVLPSRRSETWGLVVNEALHHGLPCVVSDRVGCAPDLVRPGVTGDVFETDSADALARAIDRGSSLTGRADVRAACRRQADAYSVVNAARGIAEAYQDVVASREPAA
jgi:glycosyltransferase involved in cell wall biosynthesis